MNEVRVIMVVVGGSMRIITIYAILDEHNNILSTSKTEEEAIKLVEKTKWKIVPCNGLIII